MNLQKASNIITNLVHDIVTPSFTSAIFVTLIAPWYIALPFGLIVIAAEAYATEVPR